MTRRPGQAGVSSALLTRQGVGPTWWQRRSVRRGLWRTCVYLILTFMGLLVLLPFYWQTSSALKPERDILLYPPKWIPSPLTTENYWLAIRGQLKYFIEGENPVRLEGFSVLTYFRNTMIIVVGSLIGNLSSSALVAYGLSRIRFRGREVVFATVLATMLLPWVVTLIPLFVTFARLGWTNTFLPLIAPAFFGHSFFIFLLRQFYMTIPPELEDAARIDGCSTFRSFAQITLPLAKAPLATAAIFNFQWAWNDFLRPLIYLQRPSLRTLQLGIVVFNDPYEMKWGVIMAYTSIIVIPLIAMFFLAQRFFIQGVVFTGVKG